eukprot:TRINITY_DN1983_c0_g1_i5.p1 TRINITY_DN1983_c0_g1~~TRINITY_DN1983_c0_g1_i5.p1  ORF type:complete len:160 (-),score=27.58 TRINITY_DN1983_c0_g1_i5:12-491(-)
MKGLSTHLGHLPNDLMCSILISLGSHNTIKFGLTSKHFLQVSRLDRIWKAFCNSFGLVKPGSPSLSFYDLFLLYQLQKTDFVFRSIPREVRTFLPSDDQLRLNTIINNLRETMALVEVARSFDQIIDSLFAVCEHIGFGFNRNYQECLVTPLFLSLIHI